MDGVVHAVKDAFGAALHRRVADKGETRQQRRGHKRRRRPSRRGPKAMMATSAAAKTRCVDHMWPKAVSASTAPIGSGSTAALQSSAIEAELERKPDNRCDQRHDTGGHREATYDRRQCEPETFRRVEPKIGAHAERQHRSEEMSEATEGERDHGRSPSARGSARLW